jgi:hypothetical protein
MSRDTQPPVEDEKSRGRMGALNPMWKGDAAAPESQRARARRRYKLGRCQHCGGPARDRHHVDGNPGNNEPSNGAELCRRCHMLVDGRLLRLLGRNWALRGQPRPAPKVRIRRITPEGRPVLVKIPLPFLSYIDWILAINETRRHHDWFNAESVRLYELALRALRPDEGERLQRHFQGLLPLEEFGEDGPGAAP